MCLLLYRVLGCCLSPGFHLSDEIDKNKQRKFKNCVFEGESSSLLQLKDIIKVDSDNGDAVPLRLHRSIKVQEIADKES